MAMNPGSAGDEVQLVVFRIGSQPFAVNIFQVERVLRYQEPTPLPNAPGFLEGIFPHGDRAVPLVDLRRRLGVPATVREDTRVMILTLALGPVGVVVDAVLAVRKVPAGSIVPPGTLVRGLAADFIQGVVVADGRTIVILAPAKLLTSTEQVTLRDLMVEAAS
jgi:purine-binding chemotaxis protein CheW